MNIKRNIRRFSIPLHLWEYILFGLIILYLPGIFFLELEIKHSKEISNLESHIQRIHELNEYTIEQKDNEIAILQDALNEVKEYFGYHSYGVYYQFKSIDNPPDGLPVSPEWFWITSLTGRRTNPFHSRYFEIHPGIDFITIPETEAFAAGDGIVESVKKTRIKGTEMTIDHKNGFKTRYAHLDNYYYRKGQYVIKGESIGRIGSTGVVTGRHLHYEIMFNNMHINPMVFITNHLTSDNRVYLTPHKYVALSDNAKNILDTQFIQHQDDNGGLMNRNGTLAIGGGQIFQVK